MQFEDAQSYPPEVTRALTWAEQESSIRAVLLVGSRARTEFPGDEWADYDLESFVTRVPVDAKERTWAEAFGTVWLYLYTEMDGEPHPLVVYEGDLKVDFNFGPVESLQQLVDTGQLYSSQRRGYRVLIDKDGLAARLPPPSAPRFTPLTQTEFDQTIEGFWYGVLYVAKQIRRRNLWVVKYRDWTLKTELLRLLEWRFQSTWVDGHFLTRLVDADTIASLHESFGHFDAADSWRSLRAAMALFDKTATEVGTQYGLTVNPDRSTTFRRYVDSLYAADDMIAV